MNLLYVFFLYETLQNKLRGNVRGQKGNLAVVDYLTILQTSRNHYFYILYCTETLNDTASY